MIEDDCDGIAAERQRDAARALAARADRVRFAQRGGRLYRAWLRRVTGGRLGRRRMPAEVVRLSIPWQDTESWERGDGWRTRRANLDRDQAFAVDYCLCLRCRRGWVEQPFTYPPYQRCGVASAALAQLRAEHPGFAWHTLGEHEREARPFWNAVGQGTRGGYRRADLCEHLSE